MNIRVMEKRQQGQDGTDLKRTDRATNRLTRGLLIVAGTLSVGLGVLGIFLPLWPATPFLLIAAACYAKSSKRFYNWLLGNKWFGNYIKNYREKKGIPRKIKAAAISLLWAAITFSTLFATDSLLVRIILVVIAIGATVHILSIRTLRK